MDNITIEEITVIEKSENLDSRLTEIRFGDYAYAMFDWSTKRMFIMNTEGPKSEKAMFDSFDDLVFGCQGLLRGEPLKKTIEVALQVFES